MRAPDYRVALIEKFYEAFSRKDMELSMTVLHPDSVGDWSRSRAPYAGVYRGRETTRKFWADFFDMWERIDAPIGELIEAGDRIVRVGGFTGLGRESGVEIKARGAMVFEFADGLISKLTIYQNKEEALEALGQSG